MLWSVFVPQVSYVENLIPKVMASGGKVFGRWVGLVSVKETPESLLAPSAMWGYSKKMDMYERGSGPSLDTEPGHVGTLLSDFQSPEMWEINFCDL